MSMKGLANHTVKCAKILLNQGASVLHDGQASIGAFKIEILVGVEWVDVHD